MKITKTNNKLTEDLNELDTAIDVAQDSVSEIEQQLKDNAEAASDGQQTLSDAAASSQAKELKQAASEVNAKQAVNLELANASLGTKNALTDALDACLESSLTNRRQYKRTDGTVAKGVNLLVEGLPGSGKTAIVYDWARGHNIYTVYVNAKDKDLEAFINGFTMRDTDKPRSVTKGYSDALSVLDSTENCILFVDEYNRQIKPEIRASLLTLINEKYVEGADENGKKQNHYFKNLLFTVACINPAVPTDRGAAKLNDAEKTRFAIQLVGKRGFDSTSTAAADFFKKHFDRQLQLLDPQDSSYEDDLEQYLRSQDIGTFIVSYPNFSFDVRDDLDDLNNEDASMLNQRFLVDGIDFAKGSKNKLKFWIENYANLLDKDANMLLDILDHYQEPKLEDLLAQKQEEFAEKGIDFLGLGESNATQNGNADTGTSQNPSEADTIDQEDDDDESIWGSSSNTENSTGKSAASAAAARDKMRDFINNL